MAFTSQFQPQPLGLVTVTVPGTAVQLTSNLLNFSPKVTTALTDLVVANKVSLTASKAAGAANTGNVYVGQNGMNKSTLVGVIAIIGVGGAWSWTHNVGLNVYEIDKWYLDADTAGDGVYGSINTA